MNKATAEGQAEDDDIDCTMSWSGPIIGRRLTSLAHTSVGDGRGLVKLAAGNGADM